MTRFSPPLVALTCALAFSPLLGCRGEESVELGGGGAGGEAPDWNDDSCGTAALNLPEPVELELVEGTLPPALEGTIRPGIYELTSWKLWLDPQPGNIPTEFRSAAFELRADGALRFRTRRQTSSSLGSGTYEVQEGLLSFRLECPGRTTLPAQPYTAKGDELILHTEGAQELTYRRIP